ncbi:MAG TPA: hypothetical protein DCP69_03400 [Candidatus Omnitrophica bacterium]|nr:hypothetical protein [Candidatus Omnitrophota bacterium]
MTLEPTVEQTIVDALVDLLQAIPDIVTATDGRVIPYSDAELPAGTVFTPKSESTAAGAVQMDHDLMANIVLYVADRTAQRTIRSLVAKVYAALATAENNPAGPLGVPQVIRIDDPSKAVKCIQAGDFIGSAQIALTITYRTARWAM